MNRYEQLMQLDKNKLAEYILQLEGEAIIYVPE
jgi:hypothetical protein